jgi:hypothetical protein
MPVLEWIGRHPVLTVLLVWLIGGFIDSWLFRWRQHRNYVGE